MNDFEYKKIPKKDENQVRNLVKIVYENIERKDFLIPWTEEQMNRFFDEDYSVLFGAYVEDKLVAMCQIFTPKEVEEEYYDILNIAKLEGICELGGALVLPKYRQKGIMTNLVLLAMNYFDNLKFKYIISTIHPDNLASNKIVQNLGFDLYGELITQSGYLRSLYWKKVK